MEIRAGNIYSCGKAMYRLVIQIDNNQVTYAKCHRIAGIMRTIGGGTHYLNKIKLKSFKNWADKEVTG